MTLIKDLQVQPIQLNQWQGEDKILESHYWFSLHKTYSSSRWFLICWNPKAMMFSPIADVQLVLRMDEESLVTNGLKPSKKTRKSNIEKGDSSIYIYVHISSKIYSMSKFMSQKNILF